jgi:high-affinity iron transporter
VLLTSVILILQEILEAAMLISILAVIARQLGRAFAWLFAGLTGGAAFALFYASNMRHVSEWFDYVGQEVVNALLQTSIAGALVVLTWLISSARTAEARAVAPADGRYAVAFFLFAALAICLAVTREGSEIAVYLGGFLQQPDKLQPVLLGSAIGAGIGVSIGFLLYYGLMALSGRAALIAPLLLLALFCGNMLSQSALQLTQADLVAAGPGLWDSSSWLPEQSIPGRLLYALVGYESRPSVLQVGAYLLGVGAVAGAVALGSRER